jgi:hypothetical protein
MILSRIIHHLRTQNWTAVALEFLIVILGVVIGFQVNDWAAGRADRETGRTHLSEVAEDLRADLASFDEMIDSAMYRIAGVEYLMLEARGETLPDTLVLSTVSFDIPDRPAVPAEIRDRILGWVNLVRISIGSRSGFDSLISSGHLGLVDDRSLARNIQRYYANYDDLTSTQGMIREYRNEGVRGAYRLGFSAFGELPVEQVIEAVREDIEFSAYLRTQREWAILHASLMAGLRDQAGALLAEIEAELGGVE